MKKIIVFVLVFMIAAPAFSQFKWGIKAGAETTSVPEYSVGAGSATIDALKDAAWGLQGGVFMRFTLLGIYIQPEVLFASTTYEYNVQEVASKPATVMSQKFNRLSVPLLVGLKLGPLRINAGPAASISLGSPQALINDPKFEDMYKGAIWGYQAGVGLDVLKKLTLDVRYAGSLGEKFGDAVAIGGQNFKLGYGKSSLILGVGLIF